MPLRLPRPVIAAAAAGLAVAWAAAGSVPALASGARPADQVRSQEWWLSALHVTQAWQTTMGSGVTIALLDTGVVPNHPDLTGSVILGPDLTRSGEKLGGQFFGVHGTAMASLIVGHGHGPGNADGVVGVAPGAKLLSVRVVPDGGDPALSNSSITGGLPAAIAQGIELAVASGAQVIDLPLDPGQSVSSLTATPVPVTAPFTTPTPAASAATAAAGGSAAEAAAIKFALSKGVVLVAPAGDNNSTNDAANFPAAYPGVISVGAFNSSFIKAAFSSHQSYVTLTGAGSGMTAAVPAGGYATVSSTSAASAVVTGIAALIKSQYPELTPAQVAQALTRGTVFHNPGGAADGSGAGTADAARALSAAAVIAAPGLPRAGTGAAAVQLPSPPPVPVVTDTLTVKLKRDGTISGILLAVLLLPSLAYALITRRRSRGKARVLPETATVTRTQYAYNPASDSELMSEYFAPLQGEHGSRGAAPETGGRRAAVPAAGRPEGGPGYVRGGDGQDRTAVPGSGVAPVLPRPKVPFARVTVARPPRVSGSPPWDPAPRPDGEVPWAGRNVPSAPGRRVPAQPLPAPAPGSSHGPRVVEPEWVAESADESDAGTDAPSRPIYVWNPGTTDTFPPASGDDPAAAGPDYELPVNEGYPANGRDGDSR